jgi:hypothetical protein
MFNDIQEKYFITVDANNFKKIWLLLKLPIECHH